MARILTEGFEMGSNSALDYNDSGTYGVTTAYRRTGNYSLEVKGSTAYINLPQSISEGYFRLPGRVHSFTGKIRIKDGGSTRIEILMSSSAATIYINGANQGSFGIQGTIFNTFEIYANMDTVSGEVIIKNNGIVKFQHTGNIGSTSVSRLEFWGEGAGMYIDDIAVNDTTGTEDNSWCGDGHILLYRPNATGSATMLMGSDGDQINNYALVDDIPPDGDSTYIYSGSAGYYDLYKLQDTSLPINSVIKRIWVESYSKDPDTGYLNSVIQTASGSYTSGSVQLVTNYDIQKYDEYTTNPDTGVAWTSDEIDYLQAGIQIAE